MPLLAGLLRESVLIQGGITLAFVLTTCFMWASGQDVPDRLWTADTIVLGFFFGAKAQYLTNQITGLRKR